MPIQYALLLGIPITIFFYFIGRTVLRIWTGHFLLPERRTALIFGAFGLLLVPTIWTIGCLQEEFPNVSYVAISYVVLLCEGLVAYGLIRHFYARASKGE
ncbi:MAG: hypothetical protein WCE75_14465 [Terracidiphilus sp.]